MTCDEAIRAIDAMLDGEIESGERFALEAHLGSCEACRREVDERRAFSDRLGRELHEAVASFPPAARRVNSPRRLGTWTRIAAVLLTGVVVGYAGTSLGVFRSAPAEALSVARLQAHRDAYRQRAEELDKRLDVEVQALDHMVGRAEEGPARDVGALAVARAAAQCGSPEPMVLPSDPYLRRRSIAQKLASPHWRDRGAAVWAVREMSAKEAALLREQLVPMGGSNRCFAEMVVLSAEGTGKPALDVVIEGQGSAVRFIQFSDARIRLECAANGRQDVLEAANLFDLQARHPQVAGDLGIQGTDGDVIVAGVRQTSGKVEARPLRYVPALVWTRAGAIPERVVEQMTFESVLADLGRSGVAVEEATRRAHEAIQKVRKADDVPAMPVQPDPRQTERHLAAMKSMDRAHLRLELERIQDDLATLELRCQEMARQLAMVRKARVTLESAKR